MISILRISLTEIPTYLLYLLSASVEDPTRPPVVGRLRSSQYQVRVGCSVPWYRGKIRNDANEVGCQFGLKDLEGWSKFYVFRDRVP